MGSPMHGGVLMGVPLAHGTPVGGVRVRVRVRVRVTWAVPWRVLMGRPWEGAHGTPVSSVYGRLTGVL